VRLREFTISEEDDSLRVNLTGLVSQLLGRIQDTGTKKSFSLTAFLNLLSKHGIPIDEEQLRDMVKEEPLKNLIANVKGDKIIFKGGSEDDTGEDASLEPEDTTDTLKKMANRASKSRD